MQLETLLAISATSFLWLVILFFFYYSSKKELRAIDTRHNAKLESLLTIKQAEMRASYEKGLLDAELKKDFAVVVRPWREEVESGSFWKNKKTLKIGYSHQLYSNGVPCLEPHITIHEEISVEKFNKENVEAALQRVDKLLSSLPFAKNPAVQILSSAIFSSAKK